MADIDWDHYSDLPSPRAYAKPPENAWISLTKDEWHRIHNALCHAESMYHSVFDVLKNGPEMREALTAIRQSLAPAYEQDTGQINQEFDHYRSVQTAMEFQSFWSLESTDFTTPHPFASDVIIKYRDHWGNNEDQPYPVGGATWLDVWRAADRAIQESGDGHHLFIEGFRQDPDDATIVYLETGS